MLPSPIDNDNYSTQNNKQACINLIEFSILNHLEKACKQREIKHHIKGLLRTIKAHVPYINYIVRIVQCKGFMLLSLFFDCRSLYIGRNC